MEVLRAAGFTLEQATPEMMQTAREKAVRAGVNVDVREGLAQALPFPDDSLDAVVSTHRLASHPARRAEHSSIRDDPRPGGPTP